MEYFTIENMLLYFVFSYMMLYICLELSQFCLREASGQNINNPDLAYPLLALFFPLITLVAIIIAFVLYYYIKTNIDIRYRIKLMVKGCNKYDTNIYSFMNSPYYRNLLLNDIQIGIHSSGPKPYNYKMIVKDN